MLFLNTNLNVPNLFCLSLKHILKQSISFEYFMIYNQTFSLILKTKVQHLNICDEQSIVHHFLTLNSRIYYKTMQYLYATLLFLAYKELNFHQVACKLKILHPKNFD
ncbi:hypothetical protein ACKWTF_001720 [Chironomus riparius]